MRSRGNGTSRPITGDGLITFVVGCPILSNLSRETPSIFEALLRHRLERMLFDGNVHMYRNG